MPKARLTKKQKNDYVRIITTDPDKFQGKNWLPPGLGIDPKYKNHWGVSEFIEWAAWKFAKDFGGKKDVDINALQRVVIRSGNPLVAYYFAKEIPGANINKMQKVVSKSTDRDTIQKFMRIKGAHVPSLQARIDLMEVMNS